MKPESIATLQSGHTGDGFDTILLCDARAGMANLTSMHGSERSRETAIGYTRDFPRDLAV
jgi:hypothetical protein